jgi:integrase
MSRKSSSRKRIERGLYLDGSTYYACATPPGSQAAVWKSLGPVGRMEARRLRDEFVAAVRTGRVPAAPGDRRRRTFGEVADDWLTSQQALVDVGELAPRTLDAYEVAVRLHLKPAFGSRTIRSLTANDLVAWHASQPTAGAAAWSIKGRWVALRSILAHAVRHTWIESNPADALTSRERPKTGTSRKRFLTEEEMGSLLETATGRYRVLIAVCLFAGLRISEALGLVWDDVDLEHGHLRVRYQLNRKGKRVGLKTAAARREVIVIDSLAALLRRHRLPSRHSKPGDPVFSTSTGTAMSARNTGRALAKISERAGVPDVTAHALRHTFASMLIERGRDPVFVADQLGHTNPAITLHVYAHLFRAAKQADDARPQLQAAYGGILGP